MLVSSRLGDYIGARKNETLRKAFIDSFDFTSLTLDEALRVFLTSFRLPGEAPVIALIVEAFSQRWFDTFKGKVGWSLVEEGFAGSAAGCALLPVAS